MDRDASALYLQINSSAKESSLDLAQEKEATAVGEFLQGPCPTSEELWQETLLKLTMEP